MSLTTPAEALALILEAAEPLPVERVPLAEALGRAAAEDLVATEPVPPFTNAAMDGYALRAADTTEAAEERPVRLIVSGVLSAGASTTPAVAPGTAWRIFTGAPIPPGADAVVPQEKVTRDGDTLVLAHPVKAGGDIRLAGEDLTQGEVAVARGTALRPGEIGVLASLGFGAVPVHRRARVAVLTTGNELVEAGAPLGPGRIRDANLPALCAQLAEMGAVALPFPRIPDRPEAVAEALRAATAQADLILTTGGVSVGDHDPVKPALEALGADTVFWRVAQKPGAPLGLWRLDSRPVLGLPGNPVAALLMAELYARPALRQMMGFRHRFRPQGTAGLVDGWRRGRPDGRVHFLRVRLAEGPDGLRATLTGPQGSGVLSSLMRADALAWIEAEQPDVTPGGAVRVILTGQSEDH